MDIGTLRPSPLAPASALRPGLSSEGGKDETLSVSQTRREHNTASEAILLSCQRQAGALKAARCWALLRVPKGSQEWHPVLSGEMEKLNSLKKAQGLQQDQI